MTRWFRIATAGVCAWAAVAITFNRPWTVSHTIDRTHRVHPIAPLRPTPRPRHGNEQEQHEVTDKDREALLSLLTGDEFDYRIAHNGQGVGTNGTTRLHWEVEDLDTDEYGYGVTLADAIDAMHGRTP